MLPNGSIGSTSSITSCQRFKRWRIKSGVFPGGGLLRAVVGDATTRPHQRLRAHDAVLAAQHCNVHDDSRIAASENAHRAYALTLTQIIND